MDVNGTVTATAFEGDGSTLSNVEQRFATTYFVEGDPDVFYPVSIKERKWYYKKRFFVEVLRPDISQDASWHGSLMARFESHSSAWGHGSDYCEAFIRACRPVLADFEKAHYGKALVVWLRGQTTYEIVTNHANATITDNTQGDGTITTYDNSSTQPTNPTIESWSPLTAVAARLETNGYNIRSKMRVSGTSRFEAATEFNAPVTFNDNVVLQPQGDIPMGNFGSE